MIITTLAGELDTHVYLIPFQFYKEIGGGDLSFESDLKMIL